jgi:hypothetical protein
MGTARMDPDFVLDEDLFWQKSSLPAGSVPDRTA